MIKPGGSNKKFDSRRQTVIEVDSSQRSSLSHRNKMPEAIVEEWEENVDLEVVRDKKERFRKSALGFAAKTNSEDLLPNNVNQRPKRPTI